MYKHKPESEYENETYNILLDFGIQTDHPIPTRWQYLAIPDNNISYLIIRRKDLSSREMCRFDREQNENKGKRTDKKY